MPITVAAAGLPQIPRLSGEARSYAERLFTFPAIASLSEADARADFVKPARHQQVDYVESAVALALAWTRDYPFYILTPGDEAESLRSTAARTGRSRSELIGGRSGSSLSASS